MILSGCSAQDEALLAGFESARLGPREFGHREHVRAAFLCLAANGDFGEAAVRFRRALRRFAAVHGVPGRYNETLTWAWLALVNERAQGASFAGSEDFLRRHPELLRDSGGLLSRYYDVAAISRSERAKQVFLLPDPSERRER